jgi:hypothetical protein
MRWVKLFTLLFLVSSWGSLYADVLPTSFSTPSVPTPESLSQKLNALATTLEQTLKDSQTDWEILSTVLTEHSRKLEELAMSSKGSEQEIQSMRVSLQSLDSSLQASLKEQAGLKIRLKIVGGGIVLALVMGFLCGIAAQ